MRRPMLAVLPLLLLPLVTGCGNDKPVTKAVDDDPALSGALADQIKVDPALVDSPRQGQAGGQTDPAVAARAEATRQVNGIIETAPEPGVDDAAAQKQIEAVRARMAAAAPGGGTCADKIAYASQWAGKLPAPLAVYPRGTVSEAAGTDSDGCQLRVVTFTSPVATDDILNYYFTLVRRAGYSAHHTIEGTDHVLGGERAGSAFVIYARRLGSGVSEVDLVTSGQG